MLLWILWAMGSPCSNDSGHKLRATVVNGRDESFYPIEKPMDVGTRVAQHVGFMTVSYHPRNVRPATRMLDNETLLPLTMRTILCGCCHHFH